MKKFIIDEKTGLAYTLVGDYYIPNITLSEPNKRPIGMWGENDSPISKIIARHFTTDSFSVANCTVTLPM